MRVLGGLGERPARLAWRETHMVINQEAYDAECAAIQTSPMRRHYLPNKNYRLGGLDVGSEPCESLAPAQPADALAPRALPFRPGLNAFRLCLPRRDLSAHARSPEELEDRLAAPPRTVPPSSTCASRALRPSPHRLLLSSPTGAVLEQVLTGLSGPAALLALVILSQFDPLSVSSRQGVPCF